MRIQTPSLPLAAMALLLLSACGGGGGGSSAPASAGRLHYTPNPAAKSSDWRLELDSGQDTAQLKLKLVGPDGLSAKGCSFFLSCDGTRCTWGTTTPGTAFTLGNAPQIFKSKAGDTAADLQVGLYQKSGSSPLSAAPIATVQLNLRQGVTPGPVSLDATPSKGAIYLDAGGLSQGMPTILVGELRAD